MLMRILVLIGLIGLAYYLIRRFLSASQPAQKTPDSFQPMVRCEHCGLHLPRHEAITRAGDAFYCSDKHAQHED